MSPDSVSRGPKSPSVGRLGEGFGRTKSDPYKDPKRPSLGDEPSISRVCILSKPWFSFGCDVAPRAIDTDGAVTTRTTRGSAVRDQGLILEWDHPVPVCIPVQGFSSQGSYQGYMPGPSCLGVLALPYTSGSPARTTHFGFTVQVFVSFGKRERSYQNPKETTVDRLYRCVRTPIFKTISPLHRATAFGSWWNTPRHRVLVLALRVAHPAAHGTRVLRLPCSAPGSTRPFDTCVRL